MPSAVSAKSGSESANSAHHDINNAAASLLAPPRLYHPSVFMPPFSPEEQAVIGEKQPYFERVLELQCTSTLSEPQLYAGIGDFHGL